RRETYLEPGRARLADQTGDTAGLVELAGCGTATVDDLDASVVHARIGGRRVRYALLLESVGILGDLMPGPQVALQVESFDRLERRGMRQGNAQQQGEARIGFHRRDFLVGGTGCELRRAACVQRRPRRKQ